MLIRRDLLNRLSALSLLDLAVGGISLQSCQKAAATGTRNVIKELGLYPFINAAVIYTYMTASLMS